MISGPYTFLTDTNWVMGAISLPLRTLIPESDSRFFGCIRFCLNHDTVHFTEAIEVRSVKSTEISLHGAEDVAWLRPAFLQRQQHRYPTYIAGKLG